MTNPLPHIFASLDTFFLRPIPGTPYERISNRGLVIILSGAIVFAISLWLMKKEDGKK